MIDTHSHILPVIDDGAADLAQCFFMCQMAHKDGISVVCATPHFNDYWPHNDAERVTRLTHELNDALKFHGTPIRIVPGMEIRVSVELGNLLDSAKIMGLGGSKTLLLEFHPAGVPSGFENLAKTIIQRGYSVLLAHPEKNLEIQDRPQYLFHLLRNFEPWQVLTQITAASLLGEAGRRAKRTARILLENNLAHVIASDAHDDILRPPLLSGGRDAAQNIVGNDRAYQMVHDIPKALVGNSAFPEWAPPTNPQKWWRIF